MNELLANFAQLFNAMHLLVKLSKIYEYTHSKKQSDETVGPFNVLCSQNIYILTGTLMHLNFFHSPFSSLA